MNAYHVVTENIYINSLILRINGVLNVNLAIIKINKTIPVLLVSIVLQALIQLLQENKIAYHVQKVHIGFKMMKNVLNVQLGDINIIYNKLNA